MEKKKSSWKKYYKPRFSRKALDKRVQKLEKGTVRHAHRFVTSRLERLLGVKRHVTSWIVLVLLLVGISHAQLIMAQSGYTTKAYVDGGSYSEGVLGPMETLNPIYAKSNAEKSAARLMFASLFNYDSTGHISKDLADNLVINDAEDTYTIRLKDNLKWSDGYPLTIDDVVFTADVLKDPSTNSSIAGWSSVNLKKIDNRTIQFKLPAAYSPFLHALTFPILPKHVLKDIGHSQLREHKFSNSPVTSGPMLFRVLQNVNADGSKKILHMAANPGYHKGEPKLDRFQLYVYSSRDDILKGLKVNEIAASPDIYHSDIPEAIKNRYSSSKHSINSGVYAMINMESDLLKSSAVRKALSISVDRTKLRRSLGVPSDSLAGPILADHTNFYNGEPKPNFKEAAKLLEDDGWKIVDGVRQKDGRKLELSLVSLRGRAYEKAASYLAKTWKDSLKISIDVKIVDPTDTSQNVLQSILQPRNFDILIYELVIGGDPDVYAYWHSSQANMTGLNFSNYKNGVSDDALSGGRAKRDSNLRRVKYNAFVKQWQKDIPAIALYRPQVDYVYLKSVKPMDDSNRLVESTDRYTDIIYWSVDQKLVYKTP